MPRLPFLDPFGNNKSAWDPCNHSWPFEDNRWPWLLNLLASAARVRVEIPTKLSRTQPATGVLCCPLLQIVCSAFVPATTSHGFFSVPSPRLASRPRLAAHNAIQPQLLRWPAQNRIGNQKGVPRKSCLWKWVGVWVGKDPEVSTYCTGKFQWRRTKPPKNCWAT